MHAEDYHPPWEVNFYQQLSLHISTVIAIENPAASGWIYSIDLSLPPSHLWTIQRSSSDFIYLYRKLACFLPESLLIQEQQLQILLFPLPLSAEEISAESEMTRIFFEVYLTKIITLPQVWSNSTLAQFLDNDQFLLLALWTAEKVQSLQKIITMPPNPIPVLPSQKTHLDANDQVRALSSSLLSLPSSQYFLDPRIAISSLGSQNSSFESCLCSRHKPISLS
jgi:hypothetical protein